MSLNNLNWTNRNQEDADSILTIISDCVSKYGMQLFLEALIQHNNLTIGMTNLFGVDTDYLSLLDLNLKKALDEYKNRHNEFGRK